MSNISREEDLKDLAERMANNGKRLHGKTFAGSDKAKIYNAIHGTKVADDDSLDTLLANENK